MTFRSAGAPIPFAGLIKGPYAERPRPLVAILIGFGLALVAFFITAAVPALAERSTFLFGLAALVLSLWLGGWRSGIAVISLTLVLDFVFLLPPVGVLGAKDPSDVLRLGIFAALAFTTTLFAAIAGHALQRFHYSVQLSSIIIENAPLIITGADEQGRTVLFNRMAENATGYSRNEVLGRPFLATFIPDKWRDVVSARFRNQTGDELARPHRNPWVTKGKSERYIEWRCFRVQTIDGRAMTLGIGEDVTERREAEEAARKANARERDALAALAQANQSKERFIATLSHELRTPLNAALGWMQLWRRDRDAVADRAVPSIERNLRLMAELVDDVVDYTRVELGKLTLAREKVNLHALIGATVASSQTVADHARVRLNADLPPDLPVIDADPKRVQQIVLNIIGNAIKFTPEGGEVVVAARVDGDRDVHISVQDNGAGIAPEDLDRVFDPFWQRDRKSGATRGLGLGLALVKELAEAHGGGVTIASDGPGCGTRVCVRLPASRSASQQMAG